jgi:hypothetical protein
VRAREAETETETEREGGGGVVGDGGLRRQTPTTYELHLLYGYNSTNTDTEGAGRRRGSDVRQSRMRRGMSSRGCCVNRYRSLLALLVLKYLMYQY